MVRFTRIPVLAGLLLAAGLLAPAPALAQKNSGGSGSEMPEKNAVHASCQIFWTTYGGNRSCTLLEVPAGKRLAVQHTSFLCTSPSGGAVGNTYVGGPIAGSAQSLNVHFVPLLTQPTPSNSTDVRQTGGGAMTAHFDPGAPVLANGWGVVNSFCQATLSGYLVTMP